MLKSRRSQSCPVRLDHPGAGRNGSSAVAASGGDHRGACGRLTSSREFRVGGENDSMIAGRLAASCRTRPGEGFNWLYVNSSTTPGSREARMR
jgi:hypothetical protein